MSNEKPLDPQRAEVRERLFGGEGSVSVWDLGRGALVPPFTAVVFAELSPGGSVGRHQQASDDELVIVLQGEGVLYVDGRAAACGRGSVVGLAKGSVLEIDNASIEAPLQYVIVKARRGAESKAVEPIDDRAHVPEVVEVDGHEVR